MPMDHRPARVAAIVVNWNGADDTIACLASLAAGRLAPWRVYVVDNASSDDSPDRIRAACPAARIVPAHRNDGYAAGFNLGRDQALADGADYLWLLNNDTIVDPDASRILVAADRNHGPSILAPLILLKDDRNAVWSAGGSIDWKLKTTHLPPTTDGEVRDVAWATGCSLFCSAEIARLVGPMDERYYLYLEDVDWCLRARLKGVPTRIVPDARVYHGVSRSADRLGSPVIWYYSWRNYYLLVRERGNWWQRLYAYGDLGTRLVKTCARLLLCPAYRVDSLYRARTRGFLDVVRGRFGETTLTGPRSNDLLLTGGGT